MKILKSYVKWIFLFAYILLQFQISNAQVHVNGYYRKNGTYVQPHYRSSPNSTKLDNWSTKGNVNPYTGKVGTKNVYTSPSNTYRNQNIKVGEVYSGELNNYLTHYRNIGNIERKPLYNDDNEFVCYYSLYYSDETCRKYWLYDIYAVYQGRCVIDDNGRQLFDKNDELIK